MPQDEEDEPEEAPAALPFLRGRGRPGLATEAERSYAAEASPAAGRRGRRASAPPQCVLHHEILAVKHLRNK